MAKANHRLFFIFLIWSYSIQNIEGQPFAPPPGNLGSTAISAEDPIIISWASKVKSINRGFQSLQDTTLGLATVGEADFAFGPALENGVVSLGDGGNIILEFDPPIKNGPGFDFAVFENGFSDEFLELAHVAVSSDGIQFFTFPSESQLDTTIQISAFGGMDTRKIHNLAGKYRIGFGTPFDLEELKNMSGLNLSEIRYVRITDVVGSINPSIGSRDAKGRQINDPFPTPYPSSGFDLDAIGVLNQQSYVEEDIGFSVFPNLIHSHDGVQLLANEDFQYQVFNSKGRFLESGSRTKGKQEVKFHFPVGIYFLKLTSEEHSKTYKICVR